ncbi:MAG: CoA transferase [Acidimicrobiales bacterium]
MTERRGPLAGIRVVEIATVIMGPYGAQLLGDLGAEVIKIETGRGDSSRAMGGGPHPQLSGIALNLHRNKSSIVLDLKRPEAIDVVKRLLADADVLLTNLRPGPLARLGLDYEALKDDFPRLVVCQAQGFASDSSEAGLPAYDDIIQALTGFPQLGQIAFDITHFLPTIVADKVAGTFISQGVLAALVARGTTGRGQRVEVPMFDTALAFNLVEHLARATIAGGPPGYNRVLTPHRGPHKTLDGYIAMLPYTDAQWQALFAAVGKEEILLEPSFATHRARLDNADEVYGTLGAIAAERTTADWLELCAEHAVPVAPIPPLADIVDDPAHHRGALVDREHPVAGAYRSIRAPLRFSESALGDPSPAPLVGQDTVEILRLAGLDDDAIDRLLADGVAST